MSLLDGWRLQQSLHVISNIVLLMMKYNNFLYIDNAQSFLESMMQKLHDFVNDMLLDFQASIRHVPF